MSRQEDSGLKSRRKFLKTMAATGGAVAVSAGMGQALAATDPEPEALQAEKSDTGYHETQHIRDYYARAEI